MGCLQIMSRTLKKDRNRVICLNIIKYFNISGTPYINRLFFTAFILLIIHSAALFSQPYSGTIFIDPDIITPDDSSAFESLSYNGRGMRTVYDRRSGWIEINAYLFSVTWNDGLSSEAQVNPEFVSEDAAAEVAEKYAVITGRLPHCLRVDVDALWIHKGTEPFGGGNNSILIHTGQSASYEEDGILEETLVHEASHTSLDPYHASAAGWLNAQSLDGEFISTYARDYPEREDIAESFLPWLAVRYRRDRISEQDYNTITQTIPYRLQYFDNMEFDMFPVSSVTTGLEDYLMNDNLPVLYPNPSGGIFNVADRNMYDHIRAWSLTGNIVLDAKYDGSGAINMSHCPPGIYMVELQMGDKAFNVRAIIR